MIALDLELGRDLMCYTIHEEGECASDNENACDEDDARSCDLVNCGVVRSFFLPLIEEILFIHVCTGCVGSFCSSFRSRFITFMHYIMFGGHACC